MWSFQICAGRARPVAIGPGAGLPEVRAHERLGAVQERLDEIDADHGLRRLALSDDVRREQLGIGRDAGAAVDAQRLGHARNQEEQADLARLRDVAERVEPVVAARVGNGEARVVEHRDEAGVAAPRRDVAAPVRVHRGHEDERRARDVRAAVLVECRDRFRPHSVVGLGVRLIQLVRRTDDMVERHMPSLSARTAECRKGAAFSYLST